MRIYLCRHAHAEPGDPDALRPLSAIGVEQARRLGAELAARDDRPLVVLTSPLLRARQTASLIAEATGSTVEIDDRLAPGAHPDDLADAVHGRTGPVVTVGHQPDCSEIAVALTGRDPGFPAGGMLAIDLSAPERTRPTD
jgi:phosphohistidine phosphatase